MAEAPTLKPPVALIRKLDRMAARFEQLRESLNDPGVLADHQKLKEISRESGQLEPVVTRYREYQKALREIEDLRQLIASKVDPEMAALAEAELPEAESKAAGILKD